jgi:antibiotic biosynthesis monooxygenase (ABM) superfamily enzyme
MERRLSEMVLYIMKWDIFPEKHDAYLKWIESAIPRTFGVPGVVEFRAYRPAIGVSQIVVTYEFADLATWATWYADEASQKVMDELRMYTTNLITELWGPSPVVPEPIRPCE